MSSKDKGFLGITKQQYNKESGVLLDELAQIKTIKMGNAFDANTYIRNFDAKIDNIIEILTNENNSLDKNKEFFGEKAFRNMQELPLLILTNDIYDKIKNIKTSLSSIKNDNSLAALDVRAAELKEYIRCCDIKIQLYKLKINYNTNPEKQLEFGQFKNRWEQNREKAFTRYEQTINQKFKYQVLSFPKI